MTPQILELDNGQLGYFYTLNQLEEHQMKQLYLQPYEERREKAWNPMNVRAVERSNNENIRASNQTE